MHILILNVQTPDLYFSSSTDKGKLHLQYQGIFLTSQVAIPSYVYQIITPYCLRQYPDLRLCNLSN